MKLNLKIIAAAIAVIASTALVLVSTRDQTKDGSTAESSPTPDSSALAPVLEPEDKAFARYAGSASCKECHETAYTGWAASNHGLAERNFRDDLDRSGFSPKQSLTHGDDTSEAFLNSEGIPTIHTPGPEGNRHAYPVVRVIGNDPLRQFLIPFPGGRLQTCDVSYDPAKNEWFDVFGQEERNPGDWGSWTGRGMNWNSMCAACHNTRLRKNYEPATDSYHTRMAEMSVGCESCHGPMKDHVDWQKNPPPGITDGKPDPTIRRQSRDQMLETCAPCHSRRGEITGDLIPGEPYFDHFSLTVTDGTDLYHPDGQVRDENYEVTSFMASRMHHVGVRCVDCHEPHSNQRLIPGNLLCMRCHMGGTEPPAPVIDPLAHSRHKEGSTGNDCVGCHMPITNYMQRHPRHDHGFTIPDPLLTHEFGIPNACNRCHGDKDTAWAVKYTEEWYGERMNRPTRTRARLVAQARQGDAATRPELIKLLKSEPIPAWRATACHLLARWTLADPETTIALTAALSDPSPLVREAAIRGLNPQTRNQHVATRNAIEPLLDDRFRSVRVAAAWALVESLDLTTRAGRELIHMLDINSDQPVGRMQLSQFAHLRGDTNAAIRQIRKAIEWDPNSPPFHHDLAILLSITGDLPSAIKSLENAISLDPSEAEYHYKLALARNETGDVAGAVKALRKSLELSPADARAWYNLGLALNQLNRPDEALEALRKGEAADPSDPAIPYASATILARRGNRQQALDAANRALRLRPGFPEAIQLIQSLSR